MITLQKTNEGYSLSGLSLSDLELIEELFIELFNESNIRKERHIRSQVLKIHEQIDNELIRVYADRDIQKKLPLPGG